MDCDECGYPYCSLVVPTWHGGQSRCKRSFRCSPNVSTVHSCADLAQDVLDTGTVPLLVLCIQEPEITLKRISASAMSDICKHSPELAQAVVDAGAVAYLSPLIMHPDAKLKRQASSCNELWIASRMVYL